MGKRRVESDHRRGLASPYPSQRAIPTEADHFACRCPAVRLRPQRFSLARQRPCAPSNKPVCWPASTSSTRAGGRRRRCRWFAAHPNRPGDNPPLDRRKRGAAFHLLPNLLEDARHAHKDRRPDLAHGLGQLVELGTISDLRSAGVHHVVQRPGRDVREGQKGMQASAGVNPKSAAATF